MIEPPEEIKILNLTNESYHSLGLNFTKKIIHIHLNISEISNVDEEKVYKFVGKNDGIFFQNFLLPKEIIESCRDILGSDTYKNHLDQLLDSLTRTDVCSSPVLHVVWKGESNSKRLNEVISLFSSLVSKLDNSSGSLEIEEVNQRFKIKGNTLVTERNPINFQVKNFRMERLKNSNFQETEVHISFSNLKKVHPKILINLIQAGFCLAFRKISNRLSVVATIQGFQLEISKINFDLVNWLRREAHKGSLGCEVVIKKEDILAHRIFGYPIKSMVIERNSVF